MLVTRFFHSGLVPALLSRGLLAAATSTTTFDPCVKVAGLQFADPADAIACQKSFSFNETLRQNVLSVVSRVFDFYTFEDFYLDSPPPFQDSTANIRAEIARINATQYATDYDFNRDLWDFTTQLNDGHTRWFPSCYNSYQNILPAPVVILDDGIFIAPDSVEFLNQLGSNFTDFFAEKKFDWECLAGARVLTIGGLPASDYIDEIARTVSGNFLDHNVRVNSAVSSYRIVDTDFFQRLGDLASPNFLTQTSLNFSLILVNSTTPVLIDVPFVADFLGTPFTNGRSYWAENCAANNQTNGVDLRTGSSGGAQRRPLARAVVMDPTILPKMASGLPRPVLPTLSPTNGSTGVIKSFVLPGNKTGVMFVGSFAPGPEPEDMLRFAIDVDATIKQFKASGVINLLVDVTNNPGGVVILGYALYQFLTGTEAGYPGFQSTSRANTFSQKILKEILGAEIHQGKLINGSGYTTDNFQFLNGTHMPVDFDYMDPSVSYFINGHNDPTSQRFEDVWPYPDLNNVTFPTTPPFDLNNVVIIGNGNCASTCALFTTAMFERHQTKIAVFGGNPSRPIEYKGTAGNEVLEWADLDTEIKTAGLKDDPLAPPDLLINGNMRHNWRSAYGSHDESTPIAYISEQPQYRFPYTKKTYNNPQELWLFAEQQFFYQDEYCDACV